MILKTILVDDEPLGMSMFKRECENDRRINIVGCFKRADEALNYAKENKLDFALLDIDMPGMNGITLAKELRALYPDIIIIFVTAYSKYFIETLSIRSDYFVLKPYSLADVNDILERAVLLSARAKKPIFMRTFGSFDMFIDGEPVRFTSKKSKELLALLVDRRGGEVTTGEILAYLWEDMPESDISKSYVRKALQNLRKELADIGCSELLIESQNSKSVNLQMYDCDLDKYLAGSEDAKFLGEYMSQYSWAEVTLAGLERIAEKRKAAK